MIILTIRTDNPEAEVGLYDGANQLQYETWHAHCQLAETVHNKIRHMLQSQKMSIENIKAIVCYKGPGSFTGLRIGLTVANALAYALQLPIVSETGDTWQEKGISRLLAGENEEITMPEYGADVHITLPKH